MIKLCVNNETATLKSVILGIATSNGPSPTAAEAYDPKSLEHIRKGSYPVEQDMTYEMDCFEQVLEKYDVEIIRPHLIPNYNQIFTRDIGFVIADYFIKANILPDRAHEWEAIQFVIDQIDPQKFIAPPPEVHIEGGDVILWNEYILVGTYKGTDYASYNTARTNMDGVSFLRTHFPDRMVKEFDLIKSSTDPRANALHLDCCFQPLGRDKAIILKEGFRDPADYAFLVQLFGQDKLFHITSEEMYHMYSNVFSINSETIVSEQKFTRLNNWLRGHKFHVEAVPYAEIGKQEGLLRCSTLPLFRQDD